MILIKLSLSEFNAVSKMTERDRMQAFNELIRVLQPNGTIVIVDCTPPKSHQLYLNYVQALLSLGMGDLGHRQVKSNYLIGKSPHFVIIAKKVDATSVDHLEG